ncbi:MAG: hypothetical protein ACOVQH_06205 [Burkholderiaceae bacterium]|jgi:hypothetical protein
MLAPDTPQEEIARKIAHVFSRTPAMGGSVFRADSLLTPLGYRALFYVRTAFKPSIEIRNAYSIAPIVEALQKALDESQLFFWALDTADIRVRFELFCRVVPSDNWSELEDDGPDADEPSRFGVVYRKARITSWRIRDLSKLLVSYSAWVEKSLKPNASLGSRTYAMRVYVGALK